MRSEHTSTNAASRRLLTGGCWHEAVGRALLAGRCWQSTAGRTLLADAASGTRLTRACYLETAGRRLLSEDYRLEAAAAGYCWEAVLAG
jgi:hypothetical protein